MRRIIIDGHDFNCYVTEDGRVFNHKMVERKYKVKGKGRRHIQLTCGVKLFTSVARLVANAYIPNPDNKPCVNHIDGDPSNDHVSNLEWVTHSENTQHAYDTGLKVPLPPEKNPFYKHGGKWLGDRRGENNPNYKTGYYANKQG